MGEQRPSKPNAVRRGANRRHTPRPAWFARGLTAGRLSLAPLSIATIMGDPKSEALQKLQHREPLLLGEVVPEGVAGVEHARVKLRLRGINFRLLDVGECLPEGFPILWRTPRARPG